MSELPEVVIINTREEFDAALAAQKQELFRLLDTSESGSAELSAMVKAVLSGGLLLITVDGIRPGEKWLVYETWDDTGRHAKHGKVEPFYTTSMDAKVPGENIVMLAKQHRPPGVEGERWTALQDGAKVAYLASHPILACRLNGLRA